MYKNKDKDSFDLNEAAFSNDEIHDFDYIETRTSQFGAYLVGLIGSVLMLVVLYSIFSLSLVNGESFLEKAKTNSTKEISLPVYRAPILDRNGKIIAGNSNSFSVYLNFRQAAQDEGQLNYFLDEISQIINEPKENILELIKKADLKKTSWMPIARDITPEEAIKIKDLNSPLLEVQTDYKREYVDGSAFSHIIGYVGLGEANNIEGKYGVESEYENLLKGVGGEKILFKDAKGNLVEDKILSEPNPAKPLILTIDSELQKFFSKRLKEVLNSFGLESGVGMAMDPQTGEVLAMINFPTFDNNSFVDRSRNKERISALESKSKPMLNRAISGFYSPGSIIKPMVAISALHEGIVDENTQIFSKGFITIPNPYNPETPSTFLDWRANGWVDVRNALAKSSNIFFYLVGGGLPKSVNESEYVSGNYNSKGLGIGKLYSYWNQFGLGEKTNIDLPGEMDGLLPNPDTKAKKGSNWLLGDSYNVSIGQGDLLVTPIQMLNFFSMVANGGRLLEPHILKSKEYAVLKDLTYFKNEYDVVKEGMRLGVTESYGSSHYLNDLPIEVAGKTGTPQTNNKKKVNAFFVGFAPYTDPKIAVLVFIENAREGSLNALPVAKDVFNWYYENRLSTKGGN